MEDDFWGVIPRLYTWPLQVLYTECVRLFFWYSATFQIVSVDEYEMVSRFLFLDAFSV